MKKTLRWKGQAWHSLRIFKLWLYHDASWSHLHLFNLFIVLLWSMDDEWCFLKLEPSTNMTPSLRKSSKKDAEFLLHRTSQSTQRLLMALVSTILFLYLLRHSVTVSLVNQKVPEMAMMQKGRQINRRRRRISWKGSRALKEAGSEGSKWTIHRCTVIKVKVQFARYCRCSRPSGRWNESRYPGPTQQSLWQPSRASDRLEICWPFQPNMRPEAGDPYQWWELTYHGNQ